MANQYLFDVNDYPDLNLDTDPQTLKLLEEKIGKDITRLIAETYASNDWKNFCIAQFALPYFSNISNKIKENYDKYDGELEMYPPKSLIFKAFEITPFDNIKVVLIAQGIKYVFFLFFFL